MKNIYKTIRKYLGVSEPSQEAQGMELVVAESTPLNPKVAASREPILEAWRKDPWRRDIIPRKEVPGTIYAQRSNEAWIDLVISNSKIKKEVE